MIGYNVELLALAIRAKEGWRHAGASNQDPTGGTRAYRNHNPGNLRSSPFASGSDGDYAVFHSDSVGMFALQYDIWCKANGKTVTGLTGESTLKELIYKYAPPIENESEKYLADVVRFTGFSPEMKLKELLVK